MLHCGQNECIDVCCKRYYRQSRKNQIILARPPVLMTEALDSLIYY